MMYAGVIAEEIKGKLIGNPEAAFEYVITDSRLINEQNAPKSIFVALCGEVFDGHGYIGSVAEKGVKTVLCSKMPDVECEAVILCEDTLKGLGDIALYHRKKYEIPVCAVTGSVGKTSTKEMIAAVLSNTFNVLKTEKNFNNEIGLPMTLLRMNETHTAAVVEMGMRGLGQIKYLCNFALPTIGVVTNIGVAHMELLGSRENIFKAKLEIASELPENSPLVLWGDDDFLSNRENVLKEISQYGKKFNVIYFGTGENCNFRAVNIKADADNLHTFDIETPDGCGTVSLKVPGRHNVMNAACAIAVAVSCGATLDSCINALKNYFGDGIRQNIIKKDGITIIDDTYNAGPESMKASLSVLGAMKNTGRKIAVLGDMLELGKTSEFSHREIGRFAKAQGVDVLIATGSEMLYAAEEFENTAELKDSEIYAIKTKDSTDAAKEACLLVKAGDAVLVKGSHSMHMEIVTAALRE
ncbi:MAG: UDP-N-acetylmuramoyl-tripeptide--D-alanyl-D-alanine ligase [Ruminococcaceae bacterium]|nr:UDP-N-acetylmuramoyl-tripeptide--D-alanyl-D-alanine ligase [Oscillospiraceae bacterium]